MTDKTPIPGRAITIYSDRAAEHRGGNMWPVLAFDNAAAPIIAIFGYRRAGKSTVAEYLEHHEFARHSFATPLKEMLRIGLGLTRDQLYGDQKEVPCDALGGKTPRDAMMTLGTEWGRNLYPKIWLQAFTNTRPMGNIVCDDLRFPNEHLHLMGLGAHFVRVDRPGTTPVGKVHETDAYVKKLPFDSVFENDGSLTDLHEQVDAFLRGRKSPSADRNKHFRAALKTLGA